MIELCAFVFEQVTRVLDTVILIILTRRSVVCSFFFLFKSTEQKISAESSSKIQLQIVLHNGSSSKFQFANHEGPPSQLKDRDAAKELLQQLLPRFRSKANKELEQKNK